MECNEYKEKRYLQVQELDTLQILDIRGLSGQEVGHKRGHFGRCDFESRGRTAKHSRGAVGALQCVGVCTA
jgi:hypothetical protein